MEKCKCLAPGHCPWHRGITDPERFLRCQEGRSWSSLGRPCIYLGAEVKTEGDWTGRRLGKQQSYECHLHKRCTLETNKARISACADCKDRLHIDDPDIALKFTDPLRITDRDGNNTTVLRNMLYGRAAFLVVGGPSLKSVDYNRLGERGIFSLGINNVAGFAPVSAFTCSDPPLKFHSGIFLDPKVWKFIPTPKLRKNRGKLKKKLPDGSFIDTGTSTAECPNVWGYERRSWLMPDETWFTESAAAWGNHNDGVRRTGQPKTVCTMLLGLRILQYLGARKVFLLGCDFRMDPAADLVANYAFKEDRDQGAVSSNNAQYEVVNEWLCQLRAVFDRFDRRVYNCNQTSHLRAFDYVPFEQALEICRGDVAVEPFDLHGWYAKK